MITLTHPQPGMRLREQRPRQPRAGLYRSSDRRLLDESREAVYQLVFDDRTKFMHVSGRTVVDQANGGCNVTAAHL